MMNFHPYRYKAFHSLPRFLASLREIAGAKLGGGVGWGLLLLSLLSSCTNLFMDEEKSNTAKNNFDLLWQIIDERYCFFEEKNVDWDQAYDHYWNDWLSYDDNDDPSSPYLFNTMAMMLEELRDGHVCLSGDPGSRSFTGWRDPYPENYSVSAVDAYINADRRTRRLNNKTTFSALSESIGYLRCPSFSEKFNRNDLDKAMARFEGLKGVIIDVRNNGGGLVSEAYLLASRFAREKTHVGYVRYKTGRGHNDFSDYYARYVEPDGSHRFDGKVVVITNRQVYSAANLFVSIISNLPQVCTMGDCSGGGGGVPISAELYNGWTVELSTNPVFDTNKRSIESGIAPDYPIALNNQDSQKDNIIEAAKTWILAK